MSPSGWTVEVKNLSSNATEKDVHEFFAFCGAILHFEIVRNRGSELACTAYVTFKNRHAVETAVLLSGETILGQPIRITQCARYEDDHHNLRCCSSLKIEDESGPSHSQRDEITPSAGKANNPVSLAQNAVKTMAAKSYVVGKDALGKAKAFNEYHQVSATATSKVAGLSERIGLPDKILAGVEVARSVDQRYLIYGTARRTVNYAANTVVNSSQFSRGAIWLSGVLRKASQVAADLGNRGISK